MRTGKSSAKRLDRRKGMGLSMAGFAPDRSMTAEPPASVVDARGHRCPTPTLRLRRALEALPKGGRAELWADDPLARIDVPHFANEAGHRLVATRQEGPALVFTVEKGDCAPSTDEAQD
jgi:tRNA 2-thiouridine synthesizing protein A